MYYILPLKPNVNFFTFPNAYFLEQLFKKRLSLPSSCLCPLILPTTSTHFLFLPPIPYLSHNFICIQNSFLPIFTTFSSIFVLHLSFILCVFYRVLMERSFETVSDINDKKELWKVAVKVHHWWNVIINTKEYFEMIVYDNEVSLIE